ncbi:MAG: hypothetical protein ACJ74J_13285 [Blastocatellia bacterium]
MQIPETPENVEALELMKLLKSYADGKATWQPDGAALGDDFKKACLTLYDGLAQLVGKVFAPLMDRVTSREMETYTMHDHKHGLKVLHLMWHILAPEARERLTPPEIGLMICAAHLHDLGMGLNRDERQARLDPDSDLWERLELDEPTQAAIEALRAQTESPELSDSAKGRARLQLTQAEEALLTQDTRARHATRERYVALLNMMQRMHEDDAEKIPDIKAALAFDGDSFRDKLVEICISHNEDAEALVEADKKHSGRPRFPRDYPIGGCTADLQMVAAALRLADILDFDRERTPAALFHYLLPGPLGEAENLSGREWGKHLAISSWHIEEDAIIFRGRSNSHIIHHAIVLFASAIQQEIIGTRATFGALQEVRWPFKLPTTVKTDIHEDGYRYVPYRFEIDDDRVYSLLMGGAIYENSLDAVRELVQNAVDACKLRDALLCMDGDAVPTTTNRIIVRYEEPTGECPQPRLIVRDTGTGMDALILERYFLKVGRSYYNSTEFNQTRVDLRKKNLDFAPVSEFGIGFLSTFLLANHVKVETAMGESPRSDTKKRTLQIDGPTRLIRMDEDSNEGRQRFKGTQITLYLSQGDKQDKSKPPKWEDIKDYLEEVCQDLPYDLNLEYVAGGQTTTGVIKPLPLHIEVPPEMEPFAFRIPVDDQESGLEGEIVLINSYAANKAEEERFRGKPILIAEEEREFPKNHIFAQSALLRGGFKVGAVRGLPDSLSTGDATARLRLRWNVNRNRRYILTNLARSAAADGERIGNEVYRLWLSYLIEHVEELSQGLIYRYYLPDGILNHRWLEKYDALKLYQLALNGWRAKLLNDGVTEAEISAWESGTGRSLDLPGRLSGFLLQTILPRVSNLQIANHREELVKPLDAEWRTLLSQCRDYLSAPISWESFAEYIQKIEGLLYSQYSDFFNACYRERLSPFKVDELDKLRRLLSSLIDQRVRQYVLSLPQEDVALLRRLQEVAGDLEISDGDKRWRLDSFEIPDVTE